MDNLERSIEITNALVLRPCNSVYHFCPTDKPLFYSPSVPCPFPSDTQSYINDSQMLCIYHSSFTLEIVKSVFYSLLRFPHFLFPQGFAPVTHPWLTRFPDHFPLPLLVSPAPQYKLLTINAAFSRNPTKRTLSLFSQCAFHL